MMELDLMRHCLSAFARRTVFVRGIVHRNEQRCIAIVELPDSGTDEELKSSARPLLVDAFARGEWYDSGKQQIIWREGHLVDEKDAILFNTPIVVTEGGEG